MRVTVRMVGSGPDERAERGVDISALRPPQAQLLLAFLATERHRPVSRAEVVELLWAEDPPATWEAALRGMVAKVRTFLDRHDLGPDALSAARGQYQLRLDPDSGTDLEQALDALRDAEQALAAGEAARATGLAVDAHAVFVRPLLPELPGAWAAGRRAEHLEARVRALEAIAAARGMAGDHAAAIAAARQAWTLLPLREAALRAVVAAHHAAGERVAALEAYHRGQHRLRRELGVEPSAQTQRLFMRVLREEVGPEARPGSAAPPAADEIAALRARLDDPAGARPTSERVRVLMRLGTLQRRSGTAEAAEAAFEEAAAHARMDQHTALLAEVAVAQAAFDRLAPHAPGRGLALVEEALEAGAPDAPIRTVLHSRRVQYLATALAPTHAALAATEDAARQAGPSAHRWVLAARLHDLAGPPRGEARVATAAELSGVVADSTDPELALFALEQRALGLAEYGDREGARAALAEFARRAADSGIAFPRLLALLHRGMLAAAEGRFSECEQVASELVRTGDRVAPAPILYGIRTALLYVPRWLTGRAGELLPPTVDVRAWQDRPESAAAVAFLAAQAGEVAVARSALAGVDAGSIRPTMSWGFSMFNLVGAAVTLGERGRCEQLYDLLLPSAEGVCVYGNLSYLGSFHVHLGRLARVCGRTAAALAHQEAALARHETARVGPWAALAGAELAALLRHRDRPGDADRAARLSTRVADLTAATRMSALEPLLAPGAVAGVDEEGDRDRPEDARRRRS